MGVSQSLYKVSEDIDGFEESKDTISDLSDSNEEDQLFPKTKKVIDFMLPKDFKIMIESEGGYLSMSMPLQITPIKK